MFYRLTYDHRTLQIEKQQKVEELQAVHVHTEHQTQAATALSDQCALLHSKISSVVQWMNQGVRVDTGLGLTSSMISLNQTFGSAAYPKGSMVRI